MSDDDRGMRYRYLLGALQQAQIVATVRQLAMENEQGRIQEIIEAWRVASAKMQQLSSTEPGIAEQVVVEEPPAEVVPRLKEIQSDPLFQTTFSESPISFKLVEIDKIVAPQRDVNLDYVTSLQARLKDKSMPSLVEFCLATPPEPPEIRELQTAQNQMTFSSPSLDLRFLGGFPKPMSKEDVSATHVGGMPVRVVPLFIGFGATSMNAYMIGQRIVLGNGFHRIVALRTAGITHVPILIKHIANPEIEFPQQFLNLPSSYLLSHPRPALVKDFLDPELIVEIELKPRRKTVRVTWNSEVGMIPD